MLPLTTPQKRIIFNQQIYPQSKFAHMYGFVKIDNQDKEAITKAINEAILHFDCLRIRFIKANELIYQYIAPFSEETIIDKPKDYHFLSESLPLFDPKLYRFFIVYDHLTVYGYYFIFHHAIVDAYTITLITAFIEKYLTKKELPPKSSFNHFIKAETKYLKSSAFIDDEAFFTSKLKLSNSFQPLPSFDLRSNRKSITLTNEQTKDILTFCQANKISVFKLMLTSSFLSFYQETSNMNQTIATTHHNRNTEALLLTGGMLTSTIPIVQKINPLLTFKTFLKQSTEDITLSLSKHQFPIDTLLVKKLKSECFHPTITKIIFNSIPFGSSTYKISRFSPNEDIFDLNFKLNPNSNPKGSNIELSVDYRLNLYQEQDALNILNKIVNIAFLFINDGDKVIKDLLKIKTYFIDDLNQKMLETPTRIALVDKTTSLTYQSLMLYSNALAKYLEGSQQVIGIINQRFVWYVVALIGILKAGKAFVVIDPALPRERIQKIIKQTNLQTIITFDDLTYPWDSSMNINLRKLKPLNDFVIEHADIAYLLFTSGSTGSPKGVIVSTNNLDAFYHNISSIYPTTHRSNFLAAFNYNADVAIMEILISLKTSSTLYIIDKDSLLNLNILSNYIIDNNINHLILPTAIGQMFIKHYPSSSIDSLLIAGEPMTYYQKTSYRLINAYGPTEFTILTHFKEITEKETKYPIGKPFQDITELILDENKQISNIGELYLAGPQMAIGYLNDISKTHENFVELPHYPNKFYKTNDIVERNANGDLVFLSRVDRQVKLRGHRIELGEIEANALLYPNIESALCQFSHNQLILYLVVKDKFNQNDFESFLTTKLPLEFIPKQIKLIKEIPLTTNNKIDYQLNNDALTNKKVKSINSTYEKKLLKIFKPYLKGDIITITDNILNTAIDSLDIIELSLKIEKRFKCRLKISDFYLFPTIKELALRLEEKSHQITIAKIKDGVDKPLVLIFDLSFDLIAYQNIINNFSNVPIYTISSNYIKDGETLKSYTKALIDAFNEKCLDPIIDIIGYSSGGIIALEMANQLKNRVEHLYLIDTPNYLKYPLKKKSLHLLLKRNFYHIITLYGLKKSINYLVTQSLQSFKRASLFNEQKKLIKMISQYCYQYPSNKITFFISSKMKKATDDHLGWKLTDDQVFVLEGSHVTIMKKVNALIISNIIERKRNNEIR